MLIESFAPSPDAVETHEIEIAASRESVYQALWAADFGRSRVVRGLLALRSLPRFIMHPARSRAHIQRITLHTLIDAGFGRLAEEPGREIVLGIAGRFWHPVSNTVPFSESNFRGPVPAGLARAVWNFRVREAGDRRTILSTETRVTCADRVSRRKFRAYWVVVRPFSGLIRLLMLRAVRDVCRGPVESSV
jgi:hypothetical protein